MIIERPAQEAGESDPPRVVDDRPAAQPDGAVERPRRLFGRGDGPNAAERLAAVRSRLIERRRQSKPSIPAWPRWRLVRWLRRGLVSGFFLPLTRVLYKLEVQGKLHFYELQEPVVIVSNHNMHVDAAMLLRAMPAGFRQRTAIVAAAEDIYGNRFRGFFASLLGNAFPLATEGGSVREGLENIVAMLEQKWNIVIFPEGELTVVGPMKRFKPGTGRIALETGVQVLPIRIDVLRRGFYEGKWLPHPRARVRVNVGEPFVIGREIRHFEATRMLEEA